MVEALCGPLTEKAKAAIVAKTYDNLIRELDALDNGVQAGLKLGTGLEAPVEVGLVDKTGRIGFI